MVSKKDTESLDHSAVNLIVQWKVLRSLINVCNVSSPWVQIAKMSSIYRHQTNGFNVEGWAKKDLSNWSMKRLAYDGAIRVPMAVP